MNAAGDPSVKVRPAGLEDAAGIAGVYLSAFHATYDFPLAHTDEQVRAWIRYILLPSGECWVATVGGDVVGMLVVRPGDLDQLYVAPGFQGRGVGSRLVELAKSESPDGLGLYTFQVNARARAFYERRRFVADRFGENQQARSP